MDIKKLYKNMILEAVEDCADPGLLDLVYKILINGQASAPDPSPLEMEVNYNADHQRDTKQHRPVAFRVLRSAEHTEAHTGEVGAGREKLSRVCGGFDSLSRAA